MYATANNCCSFMYGFIPSFQKSQPKPQVKGGQVGKRREEGGKARKKERGKSKSGSS
jgi:hypothetical protein